jgi:hypothetical protein
MNETPRDRKSSAFSWWLRTGRLRPAVSPDGIELKFNPWHDPADGRFTFAGAGRLYGTSGADATSAAGSRTSARTGAAPASGGPQQVADRDTVETGNIACQTTGE